MALSLHVGLIQAQPFLGPPQLFVASAQLAGAIVALLACCAHGLLLLCQLRALPSEGGVLRFERLRLRTHALQLRVALRLAFGNRRGARVEPRLSAGQHRLELCRMPLAPGGRAFAYYQRRITLAQLHLTHRHRRLAPLERSNRHRRAARRFDANACLLGALNLPQVSHLRRMHRLRRQRRLRRRRRWIIDRRARRAAPLPPRTQQPTLARTDLRLQPFHCLESPQSLVAHRRRRRLRRLRLALTRRQRRLARRHSRLAPRHLRFALGQPGARTIVTHAQRLLVGLQACPRVAHRLVAHRQVRLARAEIGLVSRPRRPRTRLLALEGRACRDQVELCRRHRRLACHERLLQALHAHQTGGSRLGTSHRRLTPLEHQPPPEQSRGLGLALAVRYDAHRGATAAAIDAIDAIDAAAPGAAAADAADAADAAGTATAADTAAAEADADAAGLSGGRRRTLRLALRRRRRERHAARRRWHRQRCCPIHKPVRARAARRDLAAAALVGGGRSARSSVAHGMGLILVGWRVGRDGGGTRDAAGAADGGGGGAGGGGAGGGGGGGSSDGGGGGDSGSGTGGCGGSIRGGGGGGSGGVAARADGRERGAEGAIPAGAGDGSDSRFAVHPSVWAWQCERGRPRGLDGTQARRQLESRQRVGASLSGMGDSGNADKVRRGGDGALAGRPCTRRAKDVAEEQHQLRAAHRRRVVCVAARECGQRSREESKRHGRRAPAAQHVGRRKHHEMHARVGTGGTGGARPLLGHPRHKPEQYARSRRTAVCGSEQQPRTAGGGRDAHFAGSGGGAGWAAGYRLEQIGDDLARERRRVRVRRVDCEH